MTIYGDGVHDDTEALNAWYEGKDVYWPDGQRATDVIGDKLNPLTVNTGRVFVLRDAETRRTPAVNTRGKN